MTAHLEDLFTKMGDEIADMFEERLGNEQVKCKNCGEIVSMSLLNIEEELCGVWYMVCCPCCSGNEFELVRE